MNTQLQQHIIFRAPLTTEQLIRSPLFWGMNGCDYAISEKNIS